MSNAPTATGTLPLEVRPAVTTKVRDCMIYAVGAAFCTMPNFASLLWRSSMKWQWSAPPVRVDVRVSNTAHQSAHAATGQPSRGRGPGPDGLGATAYPRLWPPLHPPE